MIVAGGNMVEDDKPSLMIGLTGPDLAAIAMGGGATVIEAAELEKMQLPPMVITLVLGQTNEDLIRLVQHYTVTPISFL